MANLLSKKNQVLTSRRDVLRGVTLAGAGVIASTLLAGCGGDGITGSSSATNDTKILGAAKIAEALAVAMYTGIIDDAPFFKSLPTDDQEYFVAARNEEKFHYDLLKGATGGTDAPTEYFFPVGMFTDNQVTLDTLVTLEDAFIAAYLIGVKDLSTPALRVLAAQIMGIESDHRTLARLIAGEIGLSTTTGLSGAAESVDPPNNNVYERTYGLSSIDQVVTALTPFLTDGAGKVKKVFNPSFVAQNTGLFPSPANG